jgi:NADH-quinone oxidoreductase subunit H
MISYEVSISLVIIPVIFMAGSLNFTEIVMAQTETISFISALLPLSIIFFISMIAETNRTPFDLPETEAELVAGYNVEYSSIIFAMFFLAEYGNMILMSIIKSELFLGGWSGTTYLPAATIVALKALIFCFAFVLVRATFPRYRYDQLMDIG